MESDQSKMNNFTETYINETRKLDGTNYTNWKFKIHMFLEGVSLWSIVNGDEKKSNCATSATALVQDWNKRENKVKVLLKMSIKDNIIPY